MSPHAARTPIPPFDPRPTPPRAAARGRLAAPVLLGLALGLALGMAGCATVKKDKRELALQAATNGYQSALRWGYYETAFGYVHPDLRKGKPVPESLKDLRVTGYDVVQPPLMKDETTATQLVAIDYLYEDRQVVKRLTDRQVWIWDDKLGSWWLKSGLPTFGKG